MAYGTEPPNVTAGIDLFRKQVPGELNADSYQNYEIVMRWCYEAFSQKLNATPQEVCDALLARTQKTPNSLIWDTPPDFTPAPVVLTQKQIDAEKRAKMLAWEMAEKKRREQERLDQQDQNKFLRDRQAKEAAEKAKADSAAAQSEARIQRFRIIENSSVVYRGPNRPDLSRGEGLAKALSAIVAKLPDGTIDEVETLKWVKVVIQKLPEDDGRTKPSAASVPDALERARSYFQNLREQATVKKPKDSLGDDTVAEWKNLPFGGNR